MRHAIFHTLGRSHAAIVAAGLAREERAHAGIPCADTLALALDAVTFVSNIKAIAGRAHVGACTARKAKGCFILQEFGIIKERRKLFLRTRKVRLFTKKELLPYGGKMLTYMQTVRFLSDYLEGDTYYKIQHPEHNMQRSKAQFKLLQSIEAHEEQMNDFIKSL